MISPYTIRYGVHPQHNNKRVNVTITSNEICKTFHVILRERQVKLYTSSGSTDRDVGGNTGDSIRSPVANGGFVWPHLATALAYMTMNNTNETQQILCCAVLYCVQILPAFTTFVYCCPYCMSQPSQCFTDDRVITHTEALSILLLHVLQDRFGLVTLRNTHIVLDSQDGARSPCGSKWPKCLISILIARFKSLPYYGGNLLYRAACVALRLLLCSLFRVLIVW